MVYEVARAVALPLIGIGGIASTSDALEFIIAGATAIQIGTANYYDPTVTLKVIEGLSAHCNSHRIEALGSLIGSIERE